MVRVTYSLTLFKKHGLRLLITAHETEPSWFLWRRQRKIFSCKSLLEDFSTAEDLSHSSGSAGTDDDYKVFGNEPRSEKTGLRGF